MKTHKGPEIKRYSFLSSKQNPFYPGDKSSRFHWNVVNLYQNTRRHIPARRPPLTEPQTTQTAEFLDVKAADDDDDHHHHHHYHHISVMGLGHLLTRSGLTYPEVSSKVCHDSFCRLENSVSLPWVIYYEAFYLHVVSSFSCIPVICPKLMLLLIPL